MTRILIVNPFATRVTDERAEEVADALGVSELVRTERPGHATELAADASGNVEALYVFSGDGGFNEVLNGLDRSTPVGLIPGGGASVLPRALGVPRDPVAAARALRDGIPRRISLGRVNGRRFGFSAGFGLDAEIVRRVDSLGRRADGRRPGDRAFVAAALRAVATRRGRFEPTIALEGGDRVAFVLVANGDPYTFAGRVPLHIAPAARFEGGLDVVAPRLVRARSLPRLARYAALGRGQERAADVVYLHDLDALAARADHPLPLQADGEDLGDAVEVRWEAERDAAVVLMPRA
jgi:diacylglycerol kinase family enzyme